METNSQKHLRVVLNNRLSFEDHLKMIINKVNKTIGLLRKLQNILQRPALLNHFLRNFDVVVFKVISTSKTIFKVDIKSPIFPQLILF